MKRRWAGVIAAVFGLTGSFPVLGEAPRTADGATAVREGDVYILRTVGQPERRVKVLRVSQFNDGTAVAEVQDSETGAKYAVPVPSLATARPANASAAWVPPTPTYAPASQHLTSPAALAANRPTTGGWRTYEPQPFTPTSIPIRDEPKRITAAEPVVPAEPVRTAVAGRLPSPSEIQSLTAGPPKRTFSAKSLLDPSPSPADPIRPVSALRWDEPIADEVPKPVEPAPEVIPGFQPPAPVVPLTEAPWQPSPPRKLALTPQVEDRPLVDPGIEIQSWQIPEPDILATDEVAPMVAELQRALRPSIREMAATALAEGRYGSRPAVKKAIAQVAMSDPAPSVRAHCVRCLSDLGYHEQSYVEYLRSCLGSEVPELRTSATAALAKLAPRK